MSSSITADFSKSADRARHVSTELPLEESTRDNLAYVRGAYQRAGTAQSDDT